MKIKIYPFLIGVVVIEAAAGLAAAVGAPPATKPPVVNGRTLFVTNCAVCHGANAAGEDGPNLHRKNLSEEFIRTAIEKGFKNEMPPFAGKLKDPEIKLLTTYVRSLQK